MLNITCSSLLQGPPGQLFQILLDTLLLSQLAIQTNDKYPKNLGTQIEDGTHYDYIVVGAGSAGSVVANRLSEQNTVLLLEAGTYPSATSEVPSTIFSLADTDEDWQYYSEPEKKSCKFFENSRCKWPRGKVLGGSSTINAMLYIRGAPDDYNEWSNLGNKKWAWDKVRPYFRLSENYQGPGDYGTDGLLHLSQYNSKLPLKQTIVEAAQLLGHKFADHEVPIGYFDAAQTIHDGVRWNAAKAFLGSVKERENLHVILDAFVTRVIIDDNVARGVRVNLDGTKRTFFADKEVILSAGSINTPQLLMLSGIGPKMHLEKLGLKVKVDLPVGENLQDHPMMIGFMASVDGTATVPLNLTDVLYDYFMHHQGPVAHIGLSNLMGFVSTQNEKVPNFQLIPVLFEKTNPIFVNGILNTYGFENDMKNIIWEKLEETNLFLILPILLKPKSRGRIQLKNLSPSTKPLIYPNYFDESDDIDAFLEIIAYLEKLIGTEPFKKHKTQLFKLPIKQCLKLEDNWEKYWKCVLENTASTLYHPVGTCRMGSKSDPNSVVDENLRVHNVDRLRVVDASVMPTIPRANTNAATIMLAQMGSSIILGENM